MTPSEKAGIDHCVSCFLLGRFTIRPSRIIHCVEKACVGRGEGERAGVVRAAAREINVNTKRQVVTCQSDCVVYTAVNHQPVVWEAPVRLKAESTW